MTSTVFLKQGGGNNLTCCCFPDTNHKGKKLRSNAGMGPGLEIGLKATFFLNVLKADDLSTPTLWLQENLPHLNDTNNFN